MGKPSPMPCAFGGRMVSWLPRITHDLSPPSAGVGYQPDVILWHSLLCPASRGSSQHNPWEIQASAQRGRSVTVRNGALPGLVPGSPPLLLPSHTPSSTARQSHASKYKCQRKGGKRAQLIPVLHPGCSCTRSFVESPEMLLPGDGCSGLGLRKAEETQPNTQTSSLQV